MVSVPIRPSDIVDGFRIIDNSAIVDCFLAESCLSHLDITPVIELHMEVPVNQGNDFDVVPVLHLDPTAAVFRTDYRSHWGGPGSNEYVGMAEYLVRDMHADG